MRAALIPPRGYEDTALRSDIHLLLPLEETLSNIHYLRYAKQARDRGDYIILDNGAAEGRLVEVQTLLDAARFFDAHEIVGPDILGDYEGTHDLMQFFIRSFRNEVNAGWVAGLYKIQGVLQGETHYERRRLLQFYADQPEIRVIGIPKVLVKSEGDDIRAYVANLIMQDYPDRFELHLLGASPFFTNELQVIDYPPGIRSTDSALPYKFSWKGQRLGIDKPHVKRLKTYFSESVPIDVELLDWNIMTYMRWARDA